LFIASMRAAASPRENLGARPLGPRFGNQEFRQKAALILR
jgi:hypothetical protein